jgi:hypothetical protein
MYKVRCKIVAIVLIFVVLLMSVFFWLYQCEGGRYCIEMVDLVNRNKVEEKTEIK